MNQPDSPEFTEILNRVPRWHMLTPGDKIKKGDQGYFRFMWVDATQGFGETIETNEDPMRRPIPENVRRSEAWWALYNKLTTVAPVPRFDQAHSQFIVTLYADHSGDDNPSVVLDVEEESQFNGLRGFNGSAAAYSAIRALGGEAEIIKNLQEGPGAYMRWILENH
jgi:hypothetical protein